MQKYKCSWNIVTEVQLTQSYSENVSDSQVKEVDVGGCPHKLLAYNYNTGGQVANQAKHKKEQVKCCHENQVIGSKI